MLLDSMFLFWPPRDTAVLLEKARTRRRSFAHLDALSEKLGSVERETLARHKIREESRAWHRASPRRHWSLRSEKGADRSDQQGPRSRFQDPADPRRQSGAPNDVPPERRAAALALTAGALWAMLRKCETYRRPGVFEAVV